MKACLVGLQTITCAGVAPAQQGDLRARITIDDLNVFYWGVGGKDISFPECLYDSRYLGPALFLDEPAVCTRDNVIRPRLAKDEAFLRSPMHLHDYFLCRLSYRGVNDAAAALIAKALRKISRPVTQLQTLFRKCGIRNFDRHRAECAVAKGK